MKLDLLDIILLVFIVLPVCIFFYGCGEGYPTNEPHVSKRTNTCSTQQTDAGAKITCSDGTTSIISNGQPGIQGAGGSTGLPGTTGEAGPQGNPGVTGESGPKGDVGTSGSNGIDGSNGADGIDGEDGTNGINGEDGAQGETGPKGDTGNVGPVGPKGDTGAQGVPGVVGATGPAGTPGTIILPIVPCPALSGDFREVLLCIDNSLYAVFVGKKNKIRYIQVPAGSYITTDGRSCHFTIVNHCSLTY